jgi:hypothetical protein
MKKISQEMLDKYRQLHALEKKYRVQREALRDQLITLLRAGAVVEHGALDATLQECSSMTLSKKTVVAAFGVERYEWLRARIKPTIQTQLRVMERDGGASQKAHEKEVGWSKKSSEWTG